MQRARALRRLNADHWGVCSSLRTRCRSNSRGLLYCPRSRLTDDQNPLSTLSTTVPGAAQRHVTAAAVMGGVMLLVRLARICCVHGCVWLWHRQAATPEMHLASRCCTDAALQAFVAAGQGAGGSVARHSMHSMMDCSAPAVAEMPSARATCAC